MTTPPVLRRTSAIYADDRFLVDASEHKHPEVRALALALVWILEVDPPAKRSDLWPATIRAMGFTGSYRGMLLKDAIGVDAPRYEPPGWLERTGCGAPRKRTPEPCGRNTMISFRVTDWATGQWRLASFCSRHTVEAAAESAAEKRRQEDGRIPEPTPNIGGLLAAHVPEVNWLKVYAAGKRGWTPPAIGMDRSGWPTPERIAGLEPPQLRTVFGGMESVPTDGLEGDFERPRLTVIS